MPNVREAIRAIEQDGWVHVRTRGSHPVYRHPTKAGIVTVVEHPNEEVPPGTWNNIQKQVGLK